MSKKKAEDRPYMGLGVFQPRSDAAPGTTIVGGQPDGQRRKGMVSVPVGLEQLLIVAAGDPRFRQELIRDRERAAVRRGLALTDSERAVLGSAPAEQLEAMIQRIDTSEKNLERREFLRAVAATAVTLAAGTGLEACGGSDEPLSQTGETAAPFKGKVQEVEVLAPEPMPPTGIRPEPPPEPAKPGIAGAQADAPDASVPAASPTVDIPAKKPPLTKGIRPDIPKQPQIDVKPPKAPIRGHTKH